jgi:PAS domain S-box-containing protein
MTEGTEQPLRIVFIPERDLDFSAYIGYLNQLEDVEAFIVDNVSEAFEKITTRQIDAVVSGFELPNEVNGLQFLADVRRYDLVLPFFFLSKKESQKIIAGSFQAGANDFFIADLTSEQMKLIVDAVKVSAEIASMLRQKSQVRKPSFFAEKYEVVFDELREGVMMIDAENGKLTFINDFLAEAMGRRPSELVEKDINQFLSPHKEAIDDWRRMDAIASSPGASDESIIQLCFRHVNGSSKVFWTHVISLDLTERRVLMCRCRDVTRFEQLEHEISAIRNQLKVIVENSADAIILCRDDGLIEFIGGAGPRMFGVSPEDASVANLDDLFGKSASEIRKIVRGMGSRTRISGIESNIYSRWGSHIPVHVAITKLPSSDSVTRYLLNIMDITQQKVMEAERHLIADLVNIMSSGLPATETLPNLMREIHNKILINFGMVVAIDENKEEHEIVAVENEIQNSQLRSGQKLKSDLVPVEEELWRNEGIVRNNLQSHGLHPFESLLFEEGVRAYISLPLVMHGRLIGAVHFGSKKAYALNRGHLSLFKQIATALAGSALRSQKDKAVEQMKEMLQLSTVDESGLTLFVSGSGQVEFMNEAAKNFFGSSDNSDGRMLHLVLSQRFLAVPGPGELLGGKKTELEDDAGNAWMFSSRHSQGSYGVSQVILSRK